MVGEGMETLVRRAVRPEDAGDATVGAIVREYREEYRGVWRAHSRPYPGVPGLLADMKARGVRTAVLSNKSHPFTEEMTRALLPFDFDVIRGASPGFPYKPDPAAALAIAGEMGLPPGISPSSAIRASTWRRPWRRVCTRSG